MKLVRDLHNLGVLRKSVVTIGNFDGVHLGHQALLKQLRVLSQQYQAPSVLIIFEPTPLEFFMHDKSPARLMRLREKVLALQNESIDYVLCLRFNAALAKLSAEDFVRELLLKQLGMQAIMVGDDFRFGAQRLGDSVLLKAMGEQWNFKVEQLPTLEGAAGRVSSTRIREALQAGDLSLAEQLLAKPYSVSGRVVQGYQLGRALGFPTANIQLHRKVVPLAGIFVVRIKIGSDTLQGVANIGTRPTVDGSSRVLLEVYIFDFDAMIYGHYVSVEFLKKLRNEERYDTLAALKEAIREDVEQARKYFTNGP